MPLYGGSRDVRYWAKPVSLRRRARLGTLPRAKYVAYFSMQPVEFPSSLNRFSVRFAGTSSNAVCVA